MHAQDIITEQNTVSDKIADLTSIYQSYKSFKFKKNISNKALHLTAIPLRSIAEGELSRSG